MASSERTAPAKSTLRILSGALEPTTGSVTMGADDRMSVLEQDHFKYDAYNVMDTVIMGNRRLYDIMKEKKRCMRKRTLPTRTVKKPPSWRVNCRDERLEAETEGRTSFERFGHSDDLHTAPMSALDGRQKVKVRWRRLCSAGRPSCCWTSPPTAWTLNHRLAGRIFDGLSRHHHRRQP